jgi:hypothetical protein
VVYLVEAFRSRDTMAGRDATWNARSALTPRRVRLLGRLVIPTDETEFWLFEAASRDDLTAELSAARIVGNRISLVEELTLVAGLDGGDLARHR